MAVKIAVVVGSTRPGRKALEVARWVHEHAARRSDVAYEIVDISEYALPLLDEPLPASAGMYAHEHTRTWAARIEPYDGFIFVTPEYNRGTSAALKNAIDYLYAEWNNKVAGFVSYGYVGGTRAVEQLRLTMSELQVAVVHTQVLMFHEDFENMSTFTPSPHHDANLTAMMDQVETWAAALQIVRLPVPVL